MGSEMHVIENEFLKVAVAPHGAELCSIYDKVTQHDAVWRVDPACWHRHAPVLFPFVGKVNEGVYRYKGQSYPMGQHGFARDMEFTLVEETADSITFRLCDNEESRAKYPFAFELTITHRLQGRTVTVEWKVRNPSATEPLYFSIGGHPAFNCPADAGDKKTDYFIRFDGYEQTAEIPYVLIDQPSQGIDFEHPQKLALDGGFMPVEETTFDRDAYIFDEGTVQKVTLCYPDKTPYVTLSAPGFPSFGVWSKPHSDAPYICLEPWIGRCDNMGFAGELPEKYGEQCAAPGETFEAAYTIEVN